MTNKVEQKNRNRVMSIRETSRPKLQDGTLP